MKYVLEVIIKQCYLNKFNVFLLICSIDYLNLKLG